MTISLLNGSEIVFYSKSGDLLTTLTVDETYTTDYSGGRFARLGTSDKMPITSVAIDNSSDIHVERDSTGSFWLIPSRRLDSDTLRDTLLLINLTAKTDQETIQLNDLSIRVTPKNDCAALGKNFTVRIPENKSAPQKIDFGSLVKDGDFPERENKRRFELLTVPSLYGTIDSADFSKGIFTYTIPAKKIEFPGDTFFIGDVTYSIVDSTSYDVTTLRTEYTVSFIMINTNDEPVVANPDTIQLMENTEIAVTINSVSSILANDSDLDNDIDRNGDGIVDIRDTLKVKLISSPKGTFGTLTLAENGTFSYSAATGRGEDRFQYELSDGQFKDTADIIVRVRSVNTHTPVAILDTIYVVQGSKATTFADGKTILSRIADNDFPDDTIRCIPLAMPTSCGTITVEADGTFLYSHNGSRQFSDSITVTFIDAAGHSATGTFPVKISPTTLVPLAVSITPLNGVIPDSSAIVPSMTELIVPATYMNFGTICDLALNRFVDPADLSVEADLFDVVGNKITSATYPSGNSDALNIGFHENGQLIRLFWNGTNSFGRITGGGVYLLKVRISDRYNGESVSAIELWGTRRPAVE